MTLLNDNNYTYDQHRTVTRNLAMIAALWFAAVWLTATTGVLALLWQPLIAGLVALGILVPTIWFFTVPVARRWADRVGIRTITAFHIWRIPAALTFFGYGLNGELPMLFWVLAGTGDLIAGLWALFVTAKPASTQREYLWMHRFGFADFVVAVGTGLSFTLLMDARMAPIAALPLALIPLFGVGISGATHLMAFDMLRRKKSATV